MSTRFPVSFAQRRLWFLEQLTPGEPTFLMPYAFWFDGPLDADVLQRALDALVSRHAVLRTSLVAVDGAPEQEVADPGSVTVTIGRMNLSTTPDEAERDRQAEGIAAELAVQPFDLARGPLFRAMLIKAGRERHLFVLVLHHAIGDGLSLQLMIDELSALYRAELTGTAAAEPERWLEYGDYAVWQAERLTGEELERQTAFWRSRLAGAPGVLTVPTSHPRPARLSSRGAVAVGLLSPDVARRLADAGQAVSATGFMTYLAGFAIALSRYAGQTDLVVGTPVAGRTHSELDPVVGLFANTVALRLSLADDPRFTELLARVRDVTVDAVEHQELPFEKLVEELAPDRSLAHSPVIQVQFAYQSLTPPVPTLPGIRATGRAMTTGTAKLDLTLYADASETDSVKLVLEYSTDLFDAAWAERFLGCLVRVFEAVAEAPGARVSEVPLLSGDERAALLRERSGAGADAPRPAGDFDRDVRGLLERSVARVVDGAGSATTMAEVCGRAARLARTLAARGAGPETAVGLCAGRGVGFVTGMLAAWWAGAAYVPLDPEFPAARLAGMAGDAGLVAVLTDDGHREAAEKVAEAAGSGAAVPLPVPVLSLDDPEVFAAEPLAPVAVPAEALAYLIFTSGSTGRPKGVGVSRSAVANLLTSFRATGLVTAADTFVAVTTPSFDIALLELLLPPLCGTDLVIASAAEAREPDRLRTLITAAGVTAMQATPQTWRLLLAGGGVPDGVRVRLCGGEALPRDLADQLDTPGTVLWNLYGPTETTVWSAAGPVTAGTGPVLIGAPIEHTRIYVLDDRLEPVPVGVVGEVCLGGRGVGRGYHGQARLTARAFRPDPWAGEPGARLYRTGDLGRWHPDGGLELLGRTDHQVKIHGFRVECGEIEAALRGHRDVRQAAVVAVPRGGEPALAAYVVARRGSAVAAPDADALALLRPHLEAALPTYMVPSAVTVLPALPLTPNAKVDRSALPAPDWGARPPGADRVAPRTPIEETLADIWSDLLATPTPIGMDDNLFALGGHSLTATRFVARVADVYGVAVPVHEVFAVPTIAHLAAVVAADPALAAAREGGDGVADNHPDLDELSDEELDGLLRAALAQRRRRREETAG